MTIGKFIINMTILDYIWKPFFKLMKYNKPVGTVYNIYVGPVFINFIKLKKTNEETIH